MPAIRLLFLLALCAASVAAAPIAPQARPFERIDGCTLEPDEWTDGDSFRVRLPDGRLETFRLYFVDTTESRTGGDRSDEQAKYFGITRMRAIALGLEAKEFTARALARPFTVHSRWRSLFGVRYLAMVTTGAGDDLGESLVSRGLARIYGVRTPLPDGRTSRDYRLKLRDLEQKAKGDQQGGWRLRRDNCGPLAKGS